MKWNEITWYSKWGAILLFILIIPVLAFYIGVQYQNTVEILSSAPNVVSVETQAQKDAENNASLENKLGFTFKTEDTYANVKKMFVDNGWTAIIPTQYQPMGYVPLSKTPVDPQFPEISHCSIAISNTCTVDFEKASLTASLEVTSWATTTSSGKTDWVWLAEEVE